jgi:hypothetical protein
LLAGEENLPGALKKCARSEGACLMGRRPRRGRNPAARSRIESLSEMMEARQQLRSS